MFFAVDQESATPRPSGPHRPRKSLPEPTAGIRIHQVLPSGGVLTTRAVCLWEAPDLATMEGYLEGKDQGDIAKNTYLPVNEANAMGLPR